MQRSPLSPYSQAHELYRMALSACVALLCLIGSAAKAQATETRVEHFYGISGLTASQACSHHREWPNSPCKDDWADTPCQGAEAYHGQANGIKYWWCFYSNSCPAGMEFPPDCKALNEDPPASNCVGNPINMLTGIKSQREVDYQSATGLIFERFYNSVDENKSNALIVDSHYPMGVQWRHSYALTASRSLRVFSPGSDPNAVQIFLPVVTILRPSGQRTDFALSRSDGVWESNSDNGASLTGVATREYAGGPFSSSTADIFTDESGVKHYLNSAGRVSSIVKPSGSTIQLSYDIDQNLDTVSDNYGNTIEFSYNAAGRIEEMTVGSGTYKYGYDALGNLQYVSYPDGDGVTGNNPFGDDDTYKTYHYEDSSGPHLLTGISSEDGVRYASWTYDEDHRGVSSQHGLVSEGIDKYTIDYEDYRDLTAPHVTVTDPMSRTSDYYFEVQNGIRRITQVDGAATATCAADTQLSSFTVDEVLGWVETKTDRHGAVTETKFYEDATKYGLVQRRIEAKDTDASREIKFDWTSDRRLKSREIVGHSKTEYSYDAPDHGRLKTVKITDLTTWQQPYISTGQTRTWTFDYTFHDPGTSSQLKSINAAGPIGSTLYEFSGTGLLEKVTDAVGLVRLFGNHNDRGQPGTITDPNGTVTTLGYNARGWLESSSTGIGSSNAVTEYDYYPNGQVASITLPNNVELLFRYDSAHRLYEIEDANGSTLTFGLDVMGNRVSETITDSMVTQGDPITYKVERLFDELGRILNIKSYADNHVVKLTTFNYVPAPREESTTVGGSDKITRFYDDLGRILSTKEESVPASQFAYDDGGNLKLVSDQRGITTSYQYDGLGNLMMMVSSDTGTTLYTQYDEAGNLLEKQDAKGNVTSYQYDALGRLLSITPSGPSSLTVHYNYDDSELGNYQQGKLSRMVDGTGAHYFFYNASGQLVGRTVSLEGQPYLWRYGYDLAGNLKEIRYPSGHLVTYARDDLGRVGGVTLKAWPDAQEQTLMSVPQYYAFGPLKSFTYGNGLVGTITRDTSYSHSNIVAGIVGGASVFDLTFAYNAEGNIESITNNDDSARDQTFTYDYANRLKTADGLYGLLEYEYDDGGNRQLLERGNGSQDTSYTISETSNRLDVVSGGGADHSLTYDANGNLTYDPRASNFLFYNEANRLYRVNASGVVREYRHNGLGQRVAVADYMLSNEAYTHFHYDPQGRLVAETDADGAIQREYIYLEDKILAVIEPGTDTDGDGMDDEWEQQFFGDLSWDGSGDEDDDGLSDYQEYVQGYSPKSNVGEDMDGDGLADFWEFQNFGDLSQDGDGDYDQDGISNLEEYASGYDPLVVTTHAWLVPVTTILLL